MGTTGFKKNLRGAQTYASPATPAYRDNYERIFGSQKKEPERCEHDYKADDGGIRKSCRFCGRELNMDSR